MDDFSTCKDKLIGVEAGDLGLGFSLGIRISIPNHSEAKLGIMSARGA